MRIRHELTQLAKRWAEAQTDVDQEYNERGLTERFYQLRDIRDELQAQLYRDSMDCPD